MIGVVVAHGVSPGGELLARVTGSLDDERVVVAADGGALVAEALGLRPDVVIGDFDSLTARDLERLRSAGAELIGHPAAKDQSDTELAVREAVTRGAAALWILGGLGGPRFEHALANVLLLALPELAGIEAALTDGTTTVRLLDGERRRALEVHGTLGDWVSLLPLSERVTGVRTGGLAFPLRDEDLSQGPTRGLSNELTATPASIAISAGRLAVIHTRREAER